MDPRGMASDPFNATPPGSPTRNGHQGHNSDGHSTSSFATAVFQRLFHKRRPVVKDDVGSSSPISSTGQPPSSHPIEDRMIGTLYNPEDICSGCSLPRGGSEVCPVTHLHHSTDELMNVPTGCSSPEAEQTLPQEEVTLSNAMPAAAMRSLRFDLPPTSNIFHDDIALLPSPSEAAGSAEGTREIGVSPGEPSSAEPDAQYYVYTDQTGRSYYSTTSGTETQTAVLINGVKACEAEPASVGAELPPDGCSSQCATYLYEYVDETGAIQQCVYVQPDPVSTDLEEASVPSEEVSRNDTTCVGAASTDQSDATDKSRGTVPHTKAKKGLGSLISNLLHSNRKSTSCAEHSASRRARSAASSQRAGRPEGNLFVDPCVTLEDGEEAGQVREVSQVDAEVTAFLSTLDTSDANKFSKERRRRVKELESEEKRAREGLTKSHKEYIGKLLQLHRAGAHQLRKMEKTRTARVQDPHEE